MTSPLHSSPDTPIEGLVLRKFDYSETSLIFVLLTRQSGQQHFIMKGARKGSKTKFPAIDLFRRVQITSTIRPNRDLHTIKSAESLENFDAIATRPLNFRAAAWLSKFVEKTTVPEENCSQQFQALSCAFRRLTNDCETVFPICLGYIFASLDEHGILPDLTALPGCDSAMEYMLAYATDNELAPPGYSAEQWKGLFFWAMTYLKSVDYSVPDPSKLR